MNSYWFGISFFVLLLGGTGIWLWHEVRSEKKAEKGTEK